LFLFQKKSACDNLYQLQDMRGMSALTGPALSQGLQFKA
jgi:hypothetical protein